MCSLGCYTFKLMSRHVGLTGFLWFMIPTTFFSVGHWLSITESYTEQNSTSVSNGTSRYHYKFALTVSSYFSSLLEHKVVQEFAQTILTVRNQTLTKQSIWLKKNTFLVSFIGALSDNFACVRILVPHPFSL